MKLELLFKNDSIVYSTLKYLTFATGIFKTIILAEYLGATLFGIWSFSILLLQYLSYSNFGAQFVVNNELPKLIRTKEESEKLIAGTFQITVLFGALISFIFGLSTIIKPEWFQKYDIESYFLILILLGISQNINRLHTNTLKSYGELKIISLYELINGIIFLPLLLFGITSISLLLSVWLIYSLVMNFYLAYRIPESVNFFRVLDLEKYGSLVKKGWNLLIINVSLISIILLLKTYVSIYESVEVLGAVSLALSLSVATVTLTQTLISAFFPKLLDLFKNLATKEEINSLLGRISKTIIPLSYTLIIITAMAVIILSSYFESLNRIVPIFLFLGLGYNAISLATGYDILLYSKEKDYRIMMASLVGVCVCALGLVFYHFNQDLIGIKWLGLVMFLSYLAFFTVMKFETVKYAVSSKYVYFNAFLVLAIYMFNLLFFSSLLSLTGSLLIYVVCNISSYYMLIKLVGRIINEPDIHRIKR